MLCLAPGIAFSQDTARAMEFLKELEAYPHVSQVATAVAPVTDHEIGLGAIRKVRGVWQFKRSERLSGQLHSWTWQVIDGFESAEIYTALRQRLAESARSEVLFSCAGRDCGQGVQWANRVFGQRILYGRDDFQQYSVHAVDDGNRVILYSSTRSADRQYLHAEFLEINGTP